MEGEGRRGLAGCGAGLGVLSWWCRRERGAALSWRGGAAWRVARGEKGVAAWEFGRRRKKGRVGDGPGAGGAGGIRGTRAEGKESTGVSKGG
jgi:hypothetical protein